MEGEASVFSRFSQSTRLAASDLAISSGTTYDLNYCNTLSEGFDKDRHFAFLRDYEDHTILVAANFSSSDTRMKIFIPEHAFDWMDIPVTEAMYPGKVIEVVVPAYDAVKIALI